MLLRTWEQHRSAMRESWALTSIQRHSPAAGTGSFQSSVPTSCTQAGFSPFLPHQEGGFSFPVHAQHYNFMLLHLLGKHAADARGQQHECPWGDGLWCSHIVSIDFICFTACCPWRSDITLYLQVTEHFPFLMHITMHIHTCQYKIIQYFELQETHKDHPVQLPYVYSQALLYKLRAGNQW